MCTNVNTDATQEHGVATTETVILILHSAWYPLLISQLSHTQHSLPKYFSPVCPVEKTVLASPFSSLVTSSVSDGSPSLIDFIEYPCVSVDVISSGLILAEVFGSAVPMAFSVVGVSAVVLSAPELAVCAVVA